MTEITEHIQQVFQGLVQAGLFDVAEGKATLHFKDGKLQGVQLEQWAFRAEVKPTTPRLSTPPPMHKKHLP